MAEQTAAEQAIHGVVTREAAAPSAVEFETSWMVGTSTIEGIDFDAEVPCVHLREGLDCGRPADLLARACSGRVYAFCRRHWDSAANDTGRCPESDLFETRDEHYRIVEVLR